MTSRKLKPDEAAEFLGLQKPSEDTAARQRFWDLVHNGAVPHYRLGPRIIIFDERELRLWMASRRRGQEFPASVEAAA
jgi:predicted DNA-binding transcriptional regulator AlpA